MTGSLPDYNEVMRRWPEELMDYLPTELMSKAEIRFRCREGNLQHKYAVWDRGIHPCFLCPDPDHMLGISTECMTKAEIIHRCEEGSRMHKVHLELDLWQIPEWARRDTANVYSLVT